MPNIYEQFKNDPPPTAANPYAQFVEQPPAGPPVSTGRALAEGYLDTAGMGFRDEIRALSQASGLPEWMGGFRTPVGAARVGYEKFTGEPGEATATYEQTLKETRDLQKAAQEQHPGAFLTGQLGGAAVTPSLGAAKGATMVARIGNTARAGAVTGAACGFGSGETPTERAAGGAIGAVLGGSVGAVASPIADVAAFGVNKALLAGRSIYNTIRAELQPSFVENEAARRITTAIGRDVEARGGMPWDTEAVTAANQAGIPRMIGDVGDETTRALARSAANQSPEGRTALAEATGERFAGQSQRGARFVRELTGGADATTTQEQLEAAARAANRPAYAKAYAEGEAGIWHEGLAQLLQSPDVRAAAREAANTGANKAAAQGFRPPRNPFTWDENGAYTLTRDEAGNQYKPTLQFWDAVKQNLDDKIGAARRAGEKGRAADLTALNAQLKSHLDAAVPSYAQARAGAAAAFGAQDALEAGQKFVTARGQNAEYARVISRMSAAEKELFGRGFASELSDRILELRDNQNVINQAFLQSPAARQRIAMALGPDRANQLEAWLRAETLADRMRTALGNSTTTRQLAELGLAGLGGATLGEGALSGDLGKGHFITAALLLGSAYGTHRVQVVEKSVARRVGEMLASNDPAVLQRGVNAVAKSQKLMEALRGAGDAINAVLSRNVATRAGVQQATPPISQGLTQ